MSKKPKVVRKPNERLIAIGKRILASEGNESLTSIMAKEMFASEGHQAKSGQESSEQQPERDYQSPYEFQSNIRTDAMKALQCAAFLLEWNSDAGSDSISGATANGLSHILRRAAKDAAMLYTIDEVHEAGGNPFSIGRNRKKQ